MVAQVTDLDLGEFVLTLGGRGTSI